jgi:peptidoglycan/LPS O-acetylase OafA/YrhL
MDPKTLISYSGVMWPFPPHHDREMMTYSPALDGARALAIALVIGFHARVPGFQGGFIGVDLFFALSGYLITSLLVEEVRLTGRIALWGFYRNRMLRLWPPFVLMLAAYLIAAPFVWPKFDALRDALLAGAYLTDYSYPLFHRPEILGHTWSLAVEAHYYLLWPFVVAGLLRVSRQQAIAVLVCLFLAATAWRWAAWMSAADWKNLYHRFDTRLSGLVIGSLLAFAAPDVKKQQALAVGIISLSVLGVLTVILHWRNGAAVILQPLVDLASVGLVMALVSPHATRLTAILSCRPIVYVGLISYPLYLWHYPIIRALRAYDWPISIVLAITLSFVVAKLSYDYLESPLRRLRRRWLKRQLPPAGDPLQRHSAEESAAHA